MNHKRRRAKHQRAGCLLCKPNKLTANVKAERAKNRRLAFRAEDQGAGPQPVRPSPMVGETRE